MPNQKGFSKVAVIIIVLILIGGAYFVFSKKDKNIPAQNIENQNSQSSQSVDGNLSMSDWKTYRNEKYGLEFKYPNEWLIAQESNTNNIFVRLSKDGENSFSLNIGPITDIDGKKITLDEFLSFYNKNYKDTELKQGIKNINDIQMVYFDNSLVGLEKNKFVRYITERGGLKYDFDLKYTDKNNVIYFEKIISTFKFIK